MLSAILIIAIAALHVLGIAAAMCFEEQQLQRFFWVAIALHGLAMGLAMTVGALAVGGW